MCEAQLTLELGYLVAPMAFSGDTEEVVLTVNGIKKVSLHLALVSVKSSFSLAGLALPAFSVTTSASLGPPAPPLPILFTISHTSSGSSSSPHALVATHTETSGPLSLAMLGGFPRGSS